MTLPKWVEIFLDPARRTTGSRVKLIRMNY